LELSRRFQTGRGIVREAVQRLSVEGLIQTRPNCGAVVAPEAPKLIRNLIVPIRRTVEAFALELVFDSLNNEDFQVWESIIDRMRAACLTADHHELAELDIAFHRYLIDRADQPDLIAIWESLVARIRSHFRRVQRRCANLSAIPSGPASVAAVDGGVAPTAVVYFPGDGVSLSAAARGQIRSAVQAFKAGGGGGTIRVIGHASSRTANMPVEKHLELIFNESQSRANAVAQELIH
jgi:hypothetical protein